MKYFAILFISDRQHGHFYGHDAPLAVVLHHFIANVIRSYELAHQAVVVDVNVVDQSIDLISVAQWRAH